MGSLGYENKGNFKQYLVKYLTKGLVGNSIKLALAILCFIVHFQGFSQIYASFAPALTNDAGTIAQKANVGIEVGKQWDVFSLGLVLGKTSLERQTARDSTTYLEIHPNLNIFQQGKFTNTITAGIGYIFNAKQYMITEFTSGIEYTVNPQFHINISFGQYYYSGRFTASSSTFWGISGMFYFFPTNPKSLINKSKDKEMKSN